MTKTTWRDAGDYLSSLWILSRKDKRPLDFHGAFIPSVAEGLMLRHTKPGDWVWDPMAGSGTTGIVAPALDRNVFLSDLSPLPREGCIGIWEADAKTAQIGVKYVGPLESTAVPTLDWDTTSRFLFSLIILHPPYHNIIQFSDKPEDLSNCSEVTAFLSAFGRVCENAGYHLKPKGYLAVVMGDIWENAQAVPLGAYCCTAALRALGKKARLKAIVVKNIEGNRHNAHRRNLLLSRLFRWGGVEFRHEYIYSIQKAAR